MVVKYLLNLLSISYYLEDMSVRMNTERAWVSWWSMDMKAVPTSTQPGSSWFMYLRSCSKMIITYIRQKNPNRAPESMLTTKPAMRSTTKSR